MDEQKLGKCSACSGTISKQAETCPHCGQPKPNNPYIPTKISEMEGNMKTFSIIFRVIASVFIVWMLIYIWKSLPDVIEYIQYLLGSFLGEND